MTLLLAHVATVALLAVLIAPAAFFAAEAVRKIPAVRNAILCDVRPWACSTCMSWWSSLAVATAATAIFRHGANTSNAVAALPLLAAPTAAGLCLLAYRWLSGRAPAGEPPALPPASE